jgi:peptidoglycan-N-acetylglucosamine deacetylase
LLKDKTYRKKGIFPRFGWLIGIAAISCIIFTLVFTFGKSFFTPQLNLTANAEVAEVGFGDTIKTTKDTLRTFAFSFIPPDKFAAKTLKSVNTSEKVIALTFDDGPWPETTEHILKTLKKENIKATFFVIGQPLKSFPEIGKKVVADGHEIANHTVNHWYHKMSPTVAMREIEDTNKIIKEVLDVETAYFRPPGGVLTNGLVSYAHSKKDAVLMWSADSGDSQPRRPDVSTIVRNVLNQATPGGIVLMHDGGGNHENTAKALPEIITKLRAQGYRFVTTTELLELGNA